MANDLTGRVWTLDTPSATVPVYDHEVKINHIEFLGYTTATDAVVLQDRNGRDLWDSRGSTNFDVQSSHKIGWSDGLIFASLTGGSAGFVKVYID